MDGAGIGFTWRDRDVLPTVDRVYGPLAGHRSSRPTALGLAMGTLVFCLDTLEQHHSAEIDDDIQRKRTAA